MIEKLTRIVYTISLNSSTDYSTSGEIKIGTSENNSLKVTNANNKPKIVIDFSDDETFSLKKGNSYMIKTEYYYKEGKTDQEPEKYITEGDSSSIKSFTTNLNL